MTEVELLRQIKINKENISEYKREIKRLSSVIEELENSREKAKKIRESFEYGIKSKKNGIEKIRELTNSKAIMSMMNKEEENLNYRSTSSEMKFLSNIENGISNINKKISLKNDSISNYERKIRMCESNITGYNYELKVLRSEENGR